MGSPFATPLHGWHMLVKLRILRGSLKDRRGKSAGMEIVLRLPRFLIGTAADCNLRCASRVISPHHCVIHIERDRVVIRDDSSGQGSFVNNAPIEGTACLFHNDRLRIGRLEFEVLIENSAPRQRIIRRRSPLVDRSLAARETVAQATDTVVAVSGQSLEAKPSQDSTNPRLFTSRSHGLAGPRKS